MKQSQKSETRPQVERVIQAKREKGRPEGWTGALENLAKQVFMNTTKTKSR